MVYLQEAIPTTSDAVATTAQNLQAMLHGDLQVAIQRFQDVVDLTPDDDPDRAGRLQDLGIGHHDRY
ncbi:hypothetical protein B0T10DRAFT_569795 [Thelonectria olida]|uniref:Tetratricopeptide repeat protein n=1 Tax=Thelonectria olida TaxID=1576542 RepID=A0A9P8VQ30_9HYPO|nr:hypothetical protein B0T10DRAFT_569795 [Thelonectria olida]